MKLTGYLLIVIGIVLALATVAYNLIDFNNTVEQAGPLNSAGTSNSYWFAMIPAVIATVIGTWMALRGEPGYRETYDMTRQQT